MERILYITQVIFRDARCLLETALADSDSALKFFPPPPGFGQLFAFVVDMVSRSSQVRAARVYFCHGIAHLYFPRSLHIVIRRHDGHYLVHFAEPDLNRSLQQLRFFSARSRCL